MATYHSDANILIRFQCVELHGGGDRRLYPTDVVFLRPVADHDVSFGIARWWRHIVVSTKRPTSQTLA